MTRVYELIINGNPSEWTKGKLLIEYDEQKGIPWEIFEYPESYTEIDVDPLPDGMPQVKVIKTAFYSAGVLVISSLI